MRQCMEDNMVLYMYLYMNKKCFLKIFIARKLHFNLMLRETYWVEGVQDYRNTMCTNTNARPSKDSSLFVIISVKYFMENPIVPCLIPDPS